VVSVVICTYNRCEMLKQTLMSVTEVSVPRGFDWEVIVVDNNSRDATAEVVQSFGSHPTVDVRYVFEGSQGLAYARNRGVAEAKGDIVVFTDDDVTVERSWLPELARVFEDPACLAAGGKIVAVWETPKPRWLQETGPYALDKVIVSLDYGDQTIEAPKPPFGANMAFRKGVFSDYGLFRTDLGRTGSVLLSGEEIEMFLRIMRGGGKIMYAARAIVYHPVAEERVRKSYFRSWYYNAGKEEARTIGLPADSVRYFGVPRYFARSLAQACIQSLCNPDSKRRFFYNLQMYRLAGRISESRRLYRLAAGN
jgi:glycosyltransferase involved in cell wall biosynthesis